MQFWRPWRTAIRAWWKLTKRLEPIVELDPVDQVFVAGVLARQLRPLAKTITLIESQREDHKVRAAFLAALEAARNRSIELAGG